MKNQDQNSIRKKMNFETHFGQILDQFLDPKSAQNGPKTSQDGSRRGPGGARGAQNSSWKGPGGALGGNRRPIPDQGAGNTFFWRPLGAVLGASWGCLGASWGRLGPLGGLKNCS